MQRRTVLRGCGVTLAASVAGCGGNTADADGDGGDGGNAGADGDAGNAGNDDSRTDTTDDNSTVTTDSGNATTTTTEPPSMGEARLTPGESECLSGEARATIEFSDAVEVEGTISAPSPCHTPELDTASYDPDTDSLTVTVAAIDDTEDGVMCTSCVGGLQYSVRVPFENALPGAVTVRHEGSESGVVAEATR
jgi:hypothetical protein